MWYPVSEGLALLHNFPRNLELRIDGIKADRKVRRVEELYFVCLGLLSSLYVQIMRRSDNSLPGPISRRRSEIRKQGRKPWRPIDSGPCSQYKIYQSVTPLLISFVLRQTRNLS
jgi:hypothetical protein